MTHFKVTSRGRDVDFPLDEVSQSLLANTLGQQPADSFGALVVIETWLQDQLDGARGSLPILEPREYLGAQVVQRIADPELLDKLAHDDWATAKLRLLMGGQA